MCFEKAVKARPKARDKGTLFYMRIEIMSMKINCPRCNSEIDMNDHGDVFYNDDEITVDCSVCDSEFFVEPVVTFNFVVGGFTNE